MARFLGTVVGAAVLVAASIGVANAAPIIGSSGGTFGSLSGCDNSGGNRDCRIVNTVANGANTQAQWGSTSSYTNFVNPSTLTAVDVNINAATNSNDTVIARLTWVNSATLGSETPDSFGLAWTLVIAFTTPVGGDTEVFNLTVTNPTNPPGDTIGGFTLADLSNLSFNLAGITVSDLKYSVTGNNTSITNGVWYNGEDKTANLYITADFTAVSVPEPASLALFGAGLLGLGLMRRRRKAA